MVRWGVDQTTELVFLTKLCSLRSFHCIMLWHVTPCKITLDYILFSRRQFLWVNPTNWEIIKLPDERKKSDFSEGTLLVLGDEIWGLHSQAGWAGRPRGAQRAARSWLSPRTAVSWPGWVSPLLSEWEGRRGKPGLWSRAPFTERQVGSIWLRSRNFSLYPSHHASLIPNITAPDPPNVDKAPSSGLGTWPLSQLSRLKNPIIFSENLSKQGGSFEGNQG